MAWNWKAVLKTKDQLCLRTIGYKILQLPITYNFTLPPGECEPPDAAELPDVSHGAAHHAGTAAPGRGACGGEDDADHLRLPPHPAPHGGVRLPQSLHPLKPR